MAPAEVLVWAERQARNVEQAVWPRRGDPLRRAQLPPVVGEQLDVRDLVRSVCLPQALEEAHRAVGREHSVPAPDLPDLADRLLNPLDRGLRLPPERMPAGAGSRFRVLQSISLQRIEQQRPGGNRLPAIVGREAEQHHRTPTDAGLHERSLPGDVLASQHPP